MYALSVHGIFVLTLNLDCLFRAEPQEWRSRLPGIRINITLPKLVVRTRIRYEHPHSGSYPGYGRAHQGVRRQPSGERTVAATMKELWGQ